MIFVMVFLVCVFMVVRKVGIFCMVFIINVNFVVEKIVLKRCVIVWMVVV